MLSILRDVLSVLVLIGSVIGAINGILKFLGRDKIVKRYLNGIYVDFKARLTSSFVRGQTPLQGESITLA